MYQLPAGFGPIPDPTSFGSIFVQDLSFGFAVWLGIPAVVYLALLPLALRRSEPDRTEIVHEPVALREAA
jgi:hypothetical protein